MNNKKEGKPLALPHILSQEREEGEFLGVGGGGSEVGEEGRLLTPGFDTSKSCLWTQIGVHFRSSPLPASDTNAFTDPLCILREMRTGTVTYRHVLLPIL